MKCPKKILLAFAIAFSLSGIAQTFTETGITSGINFSPNPMGYMGGGVAVFDYDNDGFEDLYFTGCIENDRLFHNLGDGSFEDVTTTAGLEASGIRNTLGVTAGDIDNDGYRDIFVCTWRNINDSGMARNILFHNNGDGSFTDISDDAGIIEEAFSIGATFIDLNLDGWLDIYVGNYVDSTGFLYEDNVIVGFDHTCYENYFYLNNGDGTFVELAEEWGINDNGCALAAIASDFDLDADSDIMIANDFGEFIIPNALFENDYANEFCEDVSEESGANIALYGMGIASGDFDEDQDLDYYISNLGSNALLQNDGSGHFEDIASLAQVDNTGTDDLFYTSWGTFFFDYDNDTWLDLFVCNGHMPSVSFVANSVLDPNKLFSNNQDGTFTDVSVLEGIADENIGRGSAWGDFNNDGFPEIVTVNIFNELVAGPDNVLYFENGGNDNHWIGFTMEGVESNKDALGAVVKLYVDDRILVREVIGGGSHASQSSTRIIFGLGDYEQIDSLAVIWPGGFHESFIPEINQYHHLIEGQVTSIDETLSEKMKIKVFPNPCRNFLNIELGALNANVNLILLRDAMGRDVLTIKLEDLKRSEVLRIPLPPSLSNGLYFLNIITESEQITLPISVVKEKR